MRRLYPTVLAVHLTACFLVPTGLGLNGLVLCIADQGHVAIERPGHGCCGEPDDHGAETLSSRLNVHAEGDGRCGHCTDIPLPPTDKDPRIPLPQRPALDTLGSIPVRCVAILPETRAGSELRLDWDPSGPRKSLDSIRTVVLLL